MHVDSLHWLICAGFAFIWIIVTVVVRDRIRLTSKGSIPRDVEAMLESDARSVPPERPYLARASRGPKAIPQASSVSDAHP